MCSARRRSDAPYRDRPPLGAKVLAPETRVNGGLCMKQFHQSAAVSAARSKVAIPERLALIAALI